MVAEFRTTLATTIYSKTHSGRRDRRIALATLTGVLSKISALVLAYISVSVAVGKLGPVAFGLWMTINGLSVLMPFADLGLGNGLISLQPVLMENPTNREQAARLEHVYI